MIALGKIHQLPCREEPLVMGATWNDICREEQHLDVPGWRREVLDQRERLLAEGKAQFLDWEEAKRRIDEATQ